MKRHQGTLTSTQDGDDAGVSGGNVKKSGGNVKSMTYFFLIILSITLFLVSLAFFSVYHPSDRNINSTVANVIGGKDVIKKSYENNPHSENPQLRKSTPQTSPPSPPPTSSPRQPVFSIWESVKELFELGTTRPDELIQLLNTTNGFIDPLNINACNSGQHVVASCFSCPNESTRRIDFPLNSKVNQENAAKFRNGDSESWILYQHLRVSVMYSIIVYTCM